jgi:hypothetical protein
MDRVTHPRGPADYSPGYPAEPSSGYSTDPPVSTERANWPLLLIVGALSVALCLAVARFAMHETPAVVNGSSHPPKVLGPPKHNKPGSDKTHGGSSTAPAHSVRASGPHWSMRIAHSWKTVDVPSADEQAAWRTPGGFPGRGDVVTLVHEESSLTLHQYIQYQRNVLGVGITTASHIRTNVSHGRGGLRYHLLMDGNPARTLQVVVPTSAGFASAILIAPASTFKHDVKRISPYLKTLTGR